MSTSSVTIEIPQSLYHRLEQAATRLQKPVESLLTETLQAILPPVDEIPQHILAEVANLDNLDEVTLRQVAKSEMSVSDQLIFENLLDLQNTRPFTEDENHQLAELRTEYGRILLRKARAFALLAERGQPLSIER